MRFYRVVDQGPDTTSDKPTVSIVSPTNGFAASGSLTVTVAASTDQATLSTKLYVDGEEVPMNKDGSYVINTCEWPNGSHTLFATARCTSAAEGPDDIGVVTVGHGVSPFNSVTFSNLITRISFSQPFFNPAAGQTQQVSAVFAANCDWTLNIRDIDSNAVRMMVHGTYGSTADYTASGCKQMYFPIASGTGAQYVRESEMSFGSADPNGLKWMAIMACFGLYHVNWSSMHGQNIQPYNSNLHLILGCDTLSYTHDQLLADWAVDMFGTPGFAPLSVEQSWYDAGSWAYNDQSPATNAYPIQMIFAASGNDACLNDTLQTNSPPTGSYFYNPTTVYTPH